MAETIAFERDIQYPCIFLHKGKRDCMCLLKKLTINGDAIKIHLKIVATNIPQKGYVCTINEIALTDRGRDRNLKTSWSLSKTVEDAYMQTRNNYLECHCHHPTNELYQLGYEKPDSDFDWLKPTSWLSFLRFF